MGSNVTSVGNNAGVPLATFTTVGQDTGPLFIVNPTTSPSSVILGFKNILFQLIGSGTNFSVTIFGTIDPNTAYGAATEWVEVPAPSTEAAFQWTNPLVSQQGQKTLYCTAPFISYRAVCAALPGQSLTGSVTLLAYVVP